MVGKLYVVWSEEIKDFVVLFFMDGEIGYSFFLKYWDKIEFFCCFSDICEEFIKFVEKYKKIIKVVFFDKVIVLFVGMCDFEIQGDGRYLEEEINGFYKKLLYFVYFIFKNLDEEDIVIYDSKCIVLQCMFNDIYDFYEVMVKGKKKLMLGKWVSCKIFNGICNVIMLMFIVSNSIGGESNLKFNDMIIGLYQFMKVILFVFIYKFKNGFLFKVFISFNVLVLFVDKVIFRRVFVDVCFEVFDGWMIDEGIEKLIFRFGEFFFWYNKLEVVGYYFGFVYKDDKYFCFF